jgi:hypothetical protein
LYLQGKSRGEEVVPDRDKVVDSAGYDRIHPRGQENERDVDTNASCRDPGPGGHSGEREDSGEVEDDRDRWSDGNGDRRGGRRGGKDGATSGARRDSKRVETTPLAEGETGQHGRRKRTTADVPETSHTTIQPSQTTSHPSESTASSWTNETETYRSQSPPVDLPGHTDVSKPHRADRTRRT